MPDVDRRTRLEARWTLGRHASTLQRQAGRIADAARLQAKKVRAAADDLRQHELGTMRERVEEMISRYPARALAIAAMAGFLLARLLVTP